MLPERHPSSCGESIARSGSGRTRVERQALHLQALHLRGAACAQSPCRCGFGGNRPTSLRRPVERAVRVRIARLSRPRPRDYARRNADVRFSDVPLFDQRDEEVDRARADVLRIERQRRLICVSWRDSTLTGKNRYAGPFADGAAQESNLPSVGLPRLTGFEDRLGHRARAAPRATVPGSRFLLATASVPARPARPSVGEEKKRGRLAPPPAGP